MKQMPLALGPADGPTLDSFVAGGNALVLAQLSALSAQTATGAPPVYLCGPSGCGKTHLLRALAQAQRAAGGPGMGRDHAGDALGHGSFSVPCSAMNDCMRHLSTDSGGGRKARQQLRQREAPRSPSL